MAPNLYHSLNNYKLHTISRNILGRFITLMVLFFTLLILFLPIPFTLTGVFYHSIYITGEGQQIISSFEIIDSHKHETFDFNNTHNNTHNIRNARINNSQELDTQTQYLIITPQSFLSALEPLVTWKYQKGLHPNVVTCEEINSTYKGSDLPAKIHAFLRMYNDKTPNLKWLLIVGDADKINSRLILTNNTKYAELGNIDNFCFSDYYYSALTSTWDSNSNNVYGEPGEEDYTPELYVGRLPVSDPKEVMNAVNKILTYEKSPPDGDWFRTALMCGGLMDRPNLIDDLYTPADEGYNWYKDNAYEVIRKIWKYFPSHMINITLLDYAQIYGGQYSRSNDTLNASNVVSVFNTGASIVNFVSHGNDNGVLHYSGSDGTGYTFDYYFNHDISKKVENGYRLPFIYSSSCTSGNFTEPDDTNFELLLTSEIGGALGIIAATVDTYRLEFYENNTSYGNWWLNAEFWYRFFKGEGRFRPGEILYKLKSDYYKYYTDKSNPHKESEYQPYYRINLFSYNLLGDPEIPIYTDIPKLLKVEYQKNFSPIYRNSTLTLRILDKITNQPVHDANVCLRGKNRYSVVQTDKNGNAKFELNLHEDETLNFTVTAHNYYYYEDTINVIAREDLVINNGSISFDKNPILPEAVVNISISVYNNGTLDLSGFKVNIYADKIAQNNLISQIPVSVKIPVGNFVNVSIIWQADPGSHNIIVFIDSLDEIFEFNETNNIVEAMLIENIPPKISNLATKLIFEDTPMVNILDLNQYVWDPDTEILEFSVINISNSDLNVSINNSWLSIYPPKDWHGTASIVIGVSDGTSTDSDVLTIIVQPVNDPPIIHDTVDWIVHSENVTVAPGRITILEDQLVNISVTGTDIDDEVAKLLYYTNSEIFIINSSTGQLLFALDNSFVGEYEINFSVYDGHEQNSTAWRSVIIEVVNINDPPELILNSGTYYATVGTTFELFVTGYDIDTNDTLTFSDDTDFFDIDMATGQISFKPKDSQIGRHRITFTVSDSNESTSESIILEIKSAPDQPLEAYYILVCPIILIILFIILIIQEYLKHKREKTNDKKE